MRCPLPSSLNLLDIQERIYECTRNATALGLCVVVACLKGNLLKIGFPAATSGCSTTAERIVDVYGQRNIEMEGKVTDLQRAKIRGGSSLGVTVAASRGVS